jgi:hypothetical protein
MRKSDWSSTSSFIVVDIMVLLKNEGFLGNPFVTREDVEKGCVAREYSRFAWITT